MASAAVVEIVVYRVQQGTAQSSSAIIGGVPEVEVRIMVIVFVSTTSTETVLHLEVVFRVLEDPSPASV